MKYSLIFVCILTGIFLSSCGESTHDKLHEPKAVTQPPLTERQTATPADVDHTFEAFIAHFSKDSLFQVSRVVFPLKFKEVDMESDNLEMVERQLEKKDFHRMDFTHDESISTRNTDAYSQEFDVKNNKATIRIRGVDNGIGTDYFFEKRNGKWTLVYFEDYST